MRRFYTVTGRQVLAAAAVLALLSTLEGVGLLLLWSASRAPRGNPPPDAVAAFAETMLFQVEQTSTPAPTDTPSPTPDAAFRVEVVRETPLPALNGKRVLIYHSHTYEAYTQVADTPYEETEKWRTRDASANVVAVGTALTASLRALGCTVVHDDTAFEPPNLSTAYQRSLAMLEKRTAQGETYDLYIDLHRDAISTKSTIRRTVNIGGEEVARFMVLIGKGTGSGFDVKPNWEANYAIAEKLTDSLNHQAANLCRDIKIKTGRFNQHIAPRCVLIECGNNENTLEQVLNGVPYLAQAIVDALTDGTSADGA